MNKLAKAATITVGGAGMLAGCVVGSALGSIFGTVVATSVIRKRDQEASAREDAAAAEADPVAYLMNAIRNSREQRLADVKARVSRNEPSPFRIGNLGDFDPRY